VLLRATERGVALKREIDRVADARAADLAGGMDAGAIHAATQAMGAIRRQLEAQLRGQD
jgi:hypothetical protein